VRRRKVTVAGRGASDVDAALATLKADELRAIFGDLIPWFDEATHARFVNAVIDRAARSGSGWAPEAPTDAAVRHIEAFAKAAVQIGYADAWEVDEYLREGSKAFLRKKYPSAFRIFHALLIPVANGDIDLGQHEMVDEVLNVDTSTCAAQYAVSMYMTAAPKDRGRAVLKAIAELGGVGHFWTPLRELERVAVEPLREFDSFTVQWRKALEARVAKSRGTDWESDEVRWLHEAIARTEGGGGAWSAGTHVQTHRRPAGVVPRSCRGARLEGSFSRPRRSRRVDYR
jgi:hypothetical protein